MGVTLNDLQFGKKGVIISLNMDEALCHRMYGMGFIIGKTIEVLRRTKHTLHIKIGTTEYAIRHTDAKNIGIRK